MAKASSKAPKKPAAETPAQPYYLQKARVKDYRSVRDAEVEFKPGLNIIIGANGSGKTNFLKAVVAGVSIQEESSASVGSVFKLAGASPITFSYRENSTPPQRVRVGPGNNVLTRLDDYSPFVIWVKVGSEISKEEKANSLLDAWKSIDILNQLLPLGYDLELLSHGLPEASELAMLDQAPDWRYNSRHHLGGDFPRHLFPIVWGTHTLFSRRPTSGSAGIQPLTDIIQLVVKFHLDSFSKHLSRYTSVKSARLSDQFKVYFDEINDDFIINGLYFEYESNGNWRRFQELSDGTQRLIYLISQVTAPAYYDPNSDGLLIPLERNRIILLEEPELGIHPHQLHLLLGLIREVSAQHQVILTTHSPQVLDMLTQDELDRIIICELKDPKEGTQFTRLGKAKIAKAKRYMKEVGHLSDFWMHSDMETRSEAE